MDITIERIGPIEEGFERMRAVPLENAGQDEIYLYHGATMSLRDLWPDEINPTSLYVLEDNLEFQRQLRRHLFDRYQIDTLQLSSVLTLRNEDELVGMSPPFVEIIEETASLGSLPGDLSAPEGVSLKIPSLNDGLHRLWIAREEGLPVRCIVIHGVLPGYPHYAYPNAWSQVEVCEKVPKNKKYYRRRDPYTYMRPFGTLRELGDVQEKTEYGRTN